MPEQPFNILIADRNPHVRDFLKREMTIEGYHVTVADSGRHVLRQILHYEPIDLIILDPDLPDVDETNLLEKLRRRIPNLPIVIHTFLSDYMNDSKNLNTTAFVEKGGSSVEVLKKVIGGILSKPVMAMESDADHE